MFAVFIKYIVFISFIFYSECATRKFSLTYTYEDAVPDGYPRNLIKVNGLFPAPEIIVNKGDTIRVTVTNNFPIDTNITVHWHGMRQINTPFADGSAFDANCPIISGSAYVYNFQAYDAGTFWYHIHIMSTMADGGSGFLIVKDKAGSEPAKYDDELRLMISDWYHKNASVIEKGLLHEPFIWPGNGKSVLINGEGSYCYTLTSGFFPTSSCQVGSVANIKVEAQKTYRMRIVNTASLGYYNIAIAGHSLTVIQVDVTANSPVTMASLDIAPGQKYDVLIETNQPAASYRIEVRTNWRGDDVTASGGFFAYLNYSNSNEISALIPTSQSKDWDAQVSVLKAAKLTTIPAATRSIVLSLSQQYVNRTTFIALDEDGSNTNKNGPLKWPINQVAHKQSPTPYLLASYYGLVDDLYTMAATRPIPLAFNEAVDIIIQNRVAGNGVCEQHPWHMHGGHFWLMAQGAGLYHPDNASMFNTVDPLKVDTVVGYPTKYSKQRGKSPWASGKAYSPCGWVAIRLKPESRGMWLFHCHVSWHATMGMGVVFDVDSAGVWDSCDLPSDYGYCGDINENTINERIGADNSSDEDDLPIWVWILVSLAGLLIFCAAAALSWAFMSGAPRFLYKSGGENEMTIT